MRAQYLIALLFLTSTTLIYGEPSSTEIAGDAADFHKFRTTTLAAAAEVSGKHPGTNAGADYVAVECRKLAQRTSPDYLYGVFYDLSQDTSRTEEPFMIGECLTMAYPPGGGAKQSHKKQPTMRESQVA